MVVTQPECQRDRWGRPLIDGKVFTRASSVHVDDQSNLVRWRGRMVAQGLLRQPELITEFRDIADLAEAAFLAGGGADGANEGTAIHEAVESIIKNGVIPEDATVMADALAAVEVITGLGLTPVASELFVVDSDIEVAGTTDLLLVDGEGRAFIADLKTSGRPPHESARYGASKWACQMALYAHASPWNEHGDAVPWTELGLPEPSRSRGLVIAVHRGHAEAAPYWVDLEQGRETALLALDVIRARKRRYLL